MQDSLGSTWRRWDLHIHTPGTLKNDNFKGGNIEEKWDNYYEAIHNYIGDGTDPMKIISVMGVTDYVSMDNYFKVKNDKQLPSCIKLILPNVELRLALTGGKRPINIHCIFDPEYDDQIKDRFFAQLKFKSQHSSYSATKGELIRLGHSIKNNLNDYEAYSLGATQFLVDFQNFQQIFEQDPDLREHTFIVVSNSSNDGVSSLSRNFKNSQTSTLKNNIYYFADAIFSANPTDRQYFLGEGTDKPSDIIAQYGSLKPCINGSDAHQLDDIFEPDNQRYCWIKSEPSFEGLKQICYEPEDRVTIQPTYPYTKDPHHIIRSITLNGKDFSSEPIFLNPDLTCIIGGKSTGKTLLLRQLAYSIDPSYTKKQEKEANLPERDFLDVSSSVLWEDGLTESREIIYIPQTFLNRIIDIPEKSTVIGTLIENVLLQDANVSYAKQELENSLLSIKKQIKREIEEYLNKTDELNKINELLKRDGSTTTFATSIEKLQSQQNEIAKKSNTSDEDLFQYVELENSLQQAYFQLNSYENELTALMGIDSPAVILPGYTEISDGIISNKDFKDMFPESYADIQQELKNLSDEVLPKWNMALETIITNLSKKKDQLVSQISSQQSRYDILKIKVEQNEQLQRISQQLKEESQKFKEAEEREKKRDNLKKEIFSLKDSILSSQKEIKNAYKTYCSSVATANVEENTSLTFNAETTWKKREFLNLIGNIFDNRGFSTFRNQNNIDLTEISDNEYSKDFLNKLWDAMDNPQETGGLTLKSGYTKESALQQIFADWYNVHYLVSSEGDTMETMSPGKKALVLLELFICLGNNKCPILIDQPEDDLDNRSIYYDLVQFIKKKKKERQIIIATHNANVVLGADAEEVIIANQNGNGAENAKYKFEYRSGAIENDQPLLNEEGKLIPGVINEKGIQTQICDILEGGKTAFDLRKNKYKTIRNENKIN